MISIPYLNLNTYQPDSTCVAYRVYIVILTYLKPLEEIEVEILTHVERLNRGVKGDSWHLEDGSQELAV